MAAKARYGLAAGSGKRTSTRFAFGDGAEGNAAGGRTVAGRIGQQNRRFIARDQTLVGVGRRVGEGVDGLGMLDDAADVEQAGFGQAGIFVAGEGRLAALPDRLVHVHARAVVAEDRLRHEGRRLAIGVGDLMHDIFVDLHLVGVAHQRVELDAEFVLGGGHFVVMLFDDDAHFGQHRQHFRAHVLAGCRPAEPGNSRP